MHSPVKFVSEVKSGAKRVTAPVYSHLIYDVVPEGNKVIEQPDILIPEGLNVLQSGMDYPHDPHRVFVSDFVDFYICRCPGDTIAKLVYQSLPEIPSGRIFQS